MSFNKPVLLDDEKTDATRQRVLRLLRQQAKHIVHAKATVEHAKVQDFRASCLVHCFSPHSAFKQSLAVRCHDEVQAICLLSLRGFGKCMQAYRIHFMLEVSMPTCLMQVIQHEAALKLQRRSLSAQFIVDWHHHQQQIAATKRCIRLDIPTQLLCRKERFP